MYGVKDFSVADLPYERLFLRGVSIDAREEQSLYHISPKIFKGNVLKNLNVYRDFHPNRFVLSQNAILPEQMIFIIALNTGAVWRETLSHSVIVSCYVFHIKSNRDSGVPITQLLTNFSGTMRQNAGTSLHWRPGEDGCNSPANY